VDGYSGAAGNIVLNWDIFNVNALDNFELTPIASPQYVGLPFAVTIVAKDINGETVISFEGTAQLDARGRGEEITIGAGTSSWGYPLYTYYEDARTQVIYLAGEIGRAGRIESLWLDVTALPGQILNNWTIRMQHTPLDYYPGAAFEDAGWSTVYSRQQIITSTGWTAFEFAVPFDYNGIDNLMVDFSFNNSSWSSAGQSSYSASGDIRTLYYRSDSTYGDPLTWSGSSPIPLTSTNVPNIKLQISDGTEVLIPGAVNFTKGVWSGTVTSMAPAQNMYLVASEGLGHLGSSNPFDVKEKTAAIAAIVIDPAGIPNVHITGDSGVVIDLYAGDDFSTWQLLVSNVSLDSGEYIYPDLSGQNKTRRFYRLLIKAQGAE